MEAVESRDRVFDYRDYHRLPTRSGPIFKALNMLASHFLDKAFRVNSVSCEQMTRGEQVREARKLLGWTQEQLASRAGVSPSSVRSIEKGLIGSSDWMLRCMLAPLEDAGVVFSENESPRYKRTRVTW